MQTRTSQKQMEKISLNDFKQTARFVDYSLILMLALAGLKVIFLLSAAAGIGVLVLIMGLLVGPLFYIHLKQLRVEHKLRAEHKQLALLAEEGERLAKLVADAEERHLDDTQKEELDQKIEAWIRAAEPLRQRTWTASPAQITIQDSVHWEKLMRLFEVFAKYFNEGQAVTN